jgi:membrane-associated phospholipid phosphatase
MSKRPARGDAAPTELELVTLRERPPPSRHGPVAQLLIALAPLSLILLAYAVAHWITAPLVADGYGTGTNRLGFGLHVTGPADVDRGVFGAIPTVWLQERLVDGSAHWYDAAAALVYVTHFVSIPLITGLAWFCLRDRFSAWVAAVLAFTTLGVGVYIVYPAAPPWLASNWGEIGTVDRISSPGWDYLHLDAIGRLIIAGQEGSNPVAAMPSLHAGAAMLVALFLWPLASALWRTALLGYVLLMALTLVYTGEHYVVDVVAGWLTAGVGVVVGAAVHRRRTRRQPRAGADARERSSTPATW